MKELRLFISYGHEDNHIPIINKIKNRLEQDSHQVFRDDSIKAAENWRERLHNEIIDSNGVVAFLSKYSMREENNRPGVCLDELSIAVSVPEKKILTILLENAKDVNPPPTVSATQWIDMSNWREIYKQGEDVFNKYFEEKYSLIKEAIESDENFRFHSEIEGLRLSLQPDVSKAKFYSLLKKPLYGREWLDTEADDFFKDDFSPRFFCLYGGPGHGKSHFTAHKIHYHPQVVSGYFFEYDKKDKNAVKNFIISTAFQIAVSLQEYRSSLIKKLKDTGKYYSPKDSAADSVITVRPDVSWAYTMSDVALFRFLITEHSLIGGDSGNKVIVIDGIDEADYEDKNPLLDLLCSSAVSLLPQWIKFFVTSRKEEKIRLFFQSINAKTLDLDCPESEDDIKFYLRSKFSEHIQSGVLSENVINKISDRCEKTFIFAEMLCEAYQKDKSILNDISRLPKNINGLYYLYFSRLFEKTDYGQVKKALSVIATNNGKISEKILRKMMFADSGEMNLFLQKMRSFIKVSDEPGGTSLSFYHKTISEWIVNPEAAGEYAIDTAVGKELILDFCDSCMEKVNSADFYWGYTGNKSVLSYDELLFTFDKTNEFGSSKQKRRLKENLRFLYEMQLEAYKDSDLHFASKTAEYIEKAYSQLSQEKQTEMKKFLVGSKTLQAETELTKESPSALVFFEKIENDYMDILSSAIPLYCCIERNICFLLRKTDAPAAEKRINKLIGFINAQTYAEEQKGADLAQCYYHLCVILFNLKKYPQSIKTGILAKREAEEYFDEPDRLIALVNNQIGSCFYHISREYESKPHIKQKLLEEQLKYKKESVESRLRLYGKYSRYTALSFDYYARALLDVHRARKEKISAEAYEYAELALKTNAYTMGTDSLRYARSLLTKTYILEEEGKLQEALELACQAQKIQETFIKTEPDAAKSGNEAVKRLTKALNATENQ